MKPNLDILFFGTSAFGLPALRGLAEGGHTVRAVVTQPDRPRGRGRKPSPSPIKEEAMARGIPVLQPEKIGEIRGDLEANRPDAIVVAAYGQMLRDPIIQAPKMAAVNIHGSILPRYRGAAPIQWAIINGDTETGVTIFRIVRKMDAGPILATRSVPIGEDETAGDLEVRLSAVGGDLVREVLRDLPGALRRERAQDEGAVTLAPRLTKVDGRLAFDTSPRRIRDRVRGLHPWPGTYADLFRKERPAERVRILRVRVGEGGSSGPPGTVLSIDPEGIGVAAEGGCVVITRLQRAGGRPLSAADFLRGCTVAVGDRIA